MEEKLDSIIKNIALTNEGEGVGESETELKSNFDKESLLCLCCMEEEIDTKFSCGDQIFCSVCLSIKRLKCPYHPTCISYKALENFDRKHTLERYIKKKEEFRITSNTSGSRDSLTINRGSSERGSIVNTEIPEDTRNGQMGTFLRLRSIQNERWWLDRIKYCNYFIWLDKRNARAVNRNDLLKFFVTMLVNTFCLFLSIPLLIDYSDEERTTLEHYEQIENDVSIWSTITSFFFIMSFLTRSNCIVFVYYMSLLAMDLTLLTNIFGRVGLSNFENDTKVLISLNNYPIAIFLLKVFFESLCIND